MKLRKYVAEKLRSTPTGARLLDDRRFRLVAKAVNSLIFNLVFAFYNGILGILSHSLIFGASAVYYLLLSLMRFFAVLTHRKTDEHAQIWTGRSIGIMLIVLSAVLHIIVLISIQQQTAVPHGQITMIAIATFTFTKITTASITAGKYRKDPSKIIRAINAIRFAEVAVSLVTMQQSMLVSFGETEPIKAVILNAFTGALACFFILALGILTIKNCKKA